MAKELHAPIAVFACRSLPSKDLDIYSPGTPGHNQKGSPLSIYQRLHLWSNYLDSTDRTHLCAVLAIGAGVGIDEVLSIAFEDRICRAYFRASVTIDADIMNMGGQLTFPSPLLLGRIAA